MAVSSHQSATTSQTRRTTIHTPFSASSNVMCGQARPCLEASVMDTGPCAVACTVFMVRLVSGTSGGCRLPTLFVHPHEEGWYRLTNRYFASEDLNARPPTES